MSRPVRQCHVCGEIMHEGYCINDGEEYYCSEGCLLSVYTNEEYLDMYNEGLAYWTEWGDDDE